MVIIMTPLYYKRISLTTLSLLVLVPDEVSSLRFDEISDRSVRVSWSPPEKDNGKLTGYTVRWSVKDMPHTLKVKNVTGDIASLVVNSLQVGHSILILMLFLY